VDGWAACRRKKLFMITPAHLRGRVDLIINSSFWLGTMSGAAGKSLEDVAKPLTAHDEEAEATA
jgi:hypothetical protein